MNNFDSVFVAVKEQCGTNDAISDQLCFEKIAKAAKIPLSRIDFYLNTLESVGLIKYSMYDKYVRLTPYGKIKSHVFAGENPN